MDFLEKDLEEIIFNSDLSKLNQKGLRLQGKLKRQLRIGNYGIADLVSFKRSYFEGTNIPCLYITVIELKLNSISLSGVMQAVAYARGIQDYLEQYKPDIDYSIGIMIIGKNIDKKSGLTYIPSIFQNIKFFTYSYDIDGIIFDEVKDYALINNGF